MSPLQPASNASQCCPSSSPVPWAGTFASGPRCHFAQAGWCTGWSEPRNWAPRTLTHVRSPPSPAHGPGIPGQIHRIPLGRDEKAHVTHHMHRILGLGSASNEIWDTWNAFGFECYQPWAGHFWLSPSSLNFSFPILKSQGCFGFSIIHNWHV